MIGRFAVVVCWGGVDRPLEMFFFLVFQKVVSKVLAFEFQSEGLVIGISGRVGACLPEGNSFVVGRVSRVAQVSKDDGV